LETNPPSGPAGETEPRGLQPHDAGQSGVSNQGVDPAGSIGDATSPRAAADPAFFALHARAVESLEHCEQAIADFFAALGDSRQGVSRQTGSTAKSLAAAESKAPTIVAYLAATKNLLAFVRDADQSRIVGQQHAETQREAAHDTDFGRRFDGLTQRQKEVFRLVALGLPNKVIAHELGITETTVKAHVSVILRALGVYSRVRAIALANKSLIAVQNEPLF
jgi:ATP/maltotriose-dependent transcriptional regulator MalT